MRPGTAIHRATSGEMRAVGADKEAGVAHRKKCSPGLDGGGLVAKEESTGLGGEAGGSGEIPIRPSEGEEGGGKKTGENESGGFHGAMVAGWVGHWWG